MTGKIISLEQQSREIYVSERSSLQESTGYKTISLNQEAEIDGPISVNEHIIRRREWSRQIIAISIMASMLILMVFPFATLFIIEEVKFSDLKELLHILIPPVIGIVGAVMGFYFGERNMG